MKPREAPATAPEVQQLCKAGRSFKGTCNGQRGEVGKVSFGHLGFAHEKIMEDCGLTYLTNNGDL